MQNTKDLILSLFLLVLLRGFASAQEAGTFHVFPMVTAGELSDGSEWDGTFVATNVDGCPTTCSLELIGMPLTNIEGQHEGDQYEGDRSGYTCRTSIKN